MTAWLHVERGTVTRVLGYSDGRCIIEVRGNDTDSLYVSARGRYDRDWAVGEAVDVFRPSVEAEKVINLDSYRSSFRLSFHPADRDHSEGG